MHELKKNNEDESIGAVINSAAVTEPTRNVLNKRLAVGMTAEPRFFDKEEFMILQAVCDRLVPQEDQTRKVNIAGVLDENLFLKKGKGWRYDVMKPAGEAFKDGLRLIDKIAQTEDSKAFYEIAAPKQEQILNVIAEKKNDGPTGRFFEELLAAVAEIYYSHPYAKEAIGDLSFADAHGWKI